MKHLFRVFVLSKSEQRVVLIVIFALVVGAMVGYERRAHQFPAQPAALEVKPLPSPAETESEQ